jgi:hypothetical protein
MTGLLSKIRKLSPKRFENLCYDLLIRRGMSNVRWRTPGADGGRDIEGQNTVQDFAGDLRVERWYIECKRQVAAVDWPTVFGKIAYAENQSADYLLVLSTASLSPNCRNEVEAWNRKGRRLTIRDWSGVDIERLVSKESLLLVKYGLSPGSRNRELASLPLLKVVTKTLHQVYGESFSNGSPSPAVEFAAAAAEYATDWLSLTGGPLVHGRARLDNERDLYDWASWVGPETVRHWNPLLVRVVLSSIRFFCRAGKIELRTLAVSGRECLEFRPDMQRKSAATAQILNLVCEMADLEWEQSNAAVIISARG